MTNVDIFKETEMIDDRKMFRCAPLIFKSSILPVFQAPGSAGRGIALSMILCVDSIFGY